MFWRDALHTVLTLTQKIRLRQIDGFITQKFKTSCPTVRNLAWMYFAFLVVQQP